MRRPEVARCAIRMTYSEACWVPLQKLRMRSSRIPRFLIENPATLHERILAAALARSLDNNAALALVHLLDPPLSHTVCFLDPLTYIWRYEFGAPFDHLGGDQEMFGTHMYHPVDRLLDVLLAASVRLSGEALQHYLRRLAQPGRHADTLLEFAPIIRLPGQVPVEHEVTGYGSGSRTIDWLIKPPVGPTVLMEVKNRELDLVAFAKNVSADPSRAASAPDYDHKLLFRDVEEKFVSRLPGDCLQGVWIRSQIKQNESKLLKAFESLNADRVHFAILASWDHEAYVLTSPGIDPGFLLMLFRLTHSDRFVYRDE